MIDTESRLLRRGDYIWGSFVRAPLVDGYIVAVNPGDRSDVLGRFAFSVTSVDDAVGAAQMGLAPWAAIEAEDRADAINAIGDHLEDTADSLAKLITRETGKPLWESRAEVAAAARAARLVAVEGLASLLPSVLREDTAWSDRRALGVVAIITPFTYPLLLPILHVTAALLAGNTVVFKPSKFTPGVGQAVAELIDRCKLPRGAFNMVQGSGGVVGARIAAHPGIDALLFTGSHHTATKVRKATSDRPELPVYYQCGGKSAAIVLPDADVDLAAYELAVSAYATAGQRHDAAARILIARDRFDVFCERLIARAHELVVGYGFDPGVFMGPMISDAHRRRYRSYTGDLVALGHTPVMEGGSVEVEGHRGFYVRPSMYWVSREGALDLEPPGPVVQVYCVNDLEHATTLHEKLPFRTSTSVFTGSERTAREVSRRVSTGALYVNRGTSTTSLRLPAVARGQAGNAVPTATELVRVLSAPQAVLFDRRGYDSSRFVPGAGSLPVAPADSQGFVE